MAKKAGKSGYGASSIQVLDDITHIRKRPAMYITSTTSSGVIHLAKEAVDNALDEYLSGHANTIIVRINTKDSSISVTDNGRGIPIEKNKKTKKSTLTTVFTKLHAGGKFGKQAYSFSAGLHGVGVKAVNALSSKLEVTVARNGANYKQTFSRGLETSKVTKLKDKKLKKGTQVKFWPDEEIFSSVRFDRSKVVDWLESVSYLCPGLKIIVRVDSEKSVFKGKTLTAYLEDTLKKNRISPNHDVISVNKDGVEAAVVWASDDGESVQSFVNLSSTPDEGTHVNGLRKAITKALKPYAKKAKVSAEDLREGLYAAIHLKHKEPQFQGQTKMRLLNKDAETTVCEALHPVLVKFFKKHKAVAKAIVDKAIQLREAKSAMKEIREGLKKIATNGKGRGVLPGKLLESPNCKPSERELFIVEGDSAGGTCKKARDPYYQEVLPLRGKILNAVRATLSQLVNNEEIQAIVAAIGAGVGDTCNPKKARVGKIMLTMDADPDGKHITALALSFISEYMPQLIKSGMVYVVDSPLFVAKYRGKRYFGYTLEDLERQGIDVGTAQVSRLKGLGESDADELKQYAMDPKTRTTTRIKKKLSTKKIRRIMGSDSSARKEILGL